jgi:hypothetical protein
MLIRPRAALLAALILARPVAAQTHEYAPLILRLPSSARYLAMGNTAIGSRDDDALFYNPAQVAVARGMSLSAERFSRSSYGGSMSSVTRFNGGGIAIGAEVLSFEPSSLDVFPVTRGDLGGSYASASPGMALDVTAALAQVYKSVRVGAAAKYVAETVNGVRLGRGLVDLGVSKDFFRSYTLGLALQNLGRHNQLTGESIDLPTRLTFGATGGQQAGPFDLLMTADVSALRGGFVAPAGGAELGYSWLDGYAIALRGGARRPGQGEGAATGGAGLTIDRLSVDYALETLSHSRVAHRIGLRIR